MAQPIQTPLVGSALQRLFGLQGRVRPSLEEFIVPTVQVANLDDGSPPNVSRTASSFGSQAAVAGEFGTFRLEVPPGTIAEVLAVYLPVPSATFNLRIATTDAPAALANTGSKRFWDGRLNFENQLPAGVLTFGTQVAALTTVIGLIPVTTVENTIWTPPRGLIVGSGKQGQFGFFMIQNATANQALIATIVWREYALV